MMRVAILSRFPPEKDGIAIYSDSLCGALGGVVRIGDKDSASADYQVDFSSWKLKEQVARILEKEKIDVLHVQYIAAFYGKKMLNLNLVRALSQKVPVVVTMHEVHYTYDGYTLLRALALRLLERLVVKRADAIIVHTRQQAAFLRKKYGADASSIPMGLSAQKAHKRKGNNLLLFGMLNWGKGAEHLIDAMKLLDDCRLVIAGRPVRDGYAKHLRRKAAGMNNVTLDFRWVPDSAKETYFRNADLCVYPYVWSPYQSAALHSALEHAIPVVVSNAGALPETVREFGLGEVAARGSARALAAGIRKAFSRYAQLQKNALAYQRKASWQSVARQHRSLYKAERQKYKRRGSAQN